MNESVQGAQEFTLQDQDAVNCPVHGWMSHTIVHEAAHVVFAARHGIEFINVSVFPYEQAPTNNNGRLGGGVRLVHDGTTWVPSRRDDAFDFALIGCAAEKKAYGHELDTSRNGDLAFLRTSLGWDDSVEVSKEMDLLMKDSEKRLEAKLPLLYPDILMVFQALMAPLNVKGNRFTTFEKPLSLNSTQVFKIIGRN